MESENEGKTLFEDEIDNKKYNIFLGSGHIFTMPKTIVKCWIKNLSLLVSNSAISSVIHKLCKVYLNFLTIFKTDELDNRSPYSPFLQLMSCGFTIKILTKSEVVWVGQWETGRTKINKSNYRRKLNRCASKLKFYTLYNYSIQ